MSFRRSTKCSSLFLDLRKDLTRNRWVLQYIKRKTFHCLGFTGIFILISQSFFAMIHRIFNGNFPNENELFSFFCFSTCKVYVNVVLPEDQSPEGWITPKRTKAPWYYLLLNLWCGFKDKIEARSKIRIPGDLKESFEFRVTSIKVVTDPTPLAMNNQ